MNGEDESVDVGWDAVQIAASDNVAVALRPLRGEARVLSNGCIRRVVLANDIPMGHKFALADLVAGTAIKKYGSVIGTLSRKAAVGEHIHIQNLVSARVPKLSNSTIGEIGR